MPAIYNVIDPILGAPAPVTLTGTVKLLPIGYIARAADMATGTLNRGGAQFMYLQGSNVASLGQVVAISGSSAVLVAAANVASYNFVGVAAGNLSATNVYGWVQVQGLCDYGVTGTFSVSVAGQPVFLDTDTPGAVLTAASVSHAILGMRMASSYSSNTAVQSYNLNFPCIYGPVSAYS
jgi:hypothetical protein